ncbi:MAG: hypothetical protein ACK4Q5_05320 [Saprospiraceae bacterium]
MSGFVEKLRKESLVANEEKYYGIEPQPNANALMLELRYRDGKRLGLPYSYLTKVDFDPNVGIEIHISSVMLLIKGRGLEEIFNYLMQQRVMWIREDSTGMDTEDDASVFVESVEILKKEEPLVT